MFLNNSLAVNVTPNPGLPAQRHNLVSSGAGSAGASQVDIPPSIAQAKPAANGPDFLFVTLR
jgi:hypothetical protein